MSCRLLLALCAALSLWAVGPTAQAGEIYKWVDSQGKSHFSDKPPGADQGHPRVETLNGIPIEIQKRIRELAGNGFSISSITGDNRLCVITGDSATRVLTTAFIKRLEDNGVGILSTPLPEDTSADHGAEQFELRFSLQKEEPSHDSKSQR
jgi:hypothetical protein